MLSPVMTAAQVSVPVWAWVFFVVALLVMVAVASIGMQRARAGRPGGARARAPRGLTPEQRAFQDEMRLMLEVRLQERYGKDEDAPAEPPSEQAES
jgi:hypothetical protein